MCFMSKHLHAGSPLMCSQGLAKARNIGLQLVRLAQASALYNVSLPTKVPYKPQTHYAHGAVAAVRCHACKRCTGSARTACCWHGCTVMLQATSSTHCSDSGGLACSHICDAAPLNLCVCVYAEYLPQRTARQQRHESGSIKFGRCCRVPAEQRLGIWAWGCCLCLSSMRSSKWESGQGGASHSSATGHDCWCGWRHARLRRPQVTVCAAKLAGLWGRSP